MKNIFHLCLLSLLFSYPLIIKAETESNEAVENTYICLDESMSEISQVVSEISTLDSDLDSPVHLLKRHLENGYVLGLRDEVINVLEYADWFMNQQPITNEKRAIASKLDHVIDQVLNGDLNMTEEDVMKSSHVFKIDERLLVKGKALFKNIVVMDKKLRVHGRARFYDHVKFKDHVKFEEDVTFEDDVVFKDEVIFEDGVTFEGGLTVTDLVVLSCLDELCVITLSAVDESISGRLSVSDAVIDSAIINNEFTNNAIINNVIINDATINNAFIGNTTITLLSATDAVIQDLTVVNCIDDLCALTLSVEDASVSGALSVNDAVIQDLTVVNCIDDLCVIDLSVVDLSVSGTLSFNDAVITNATITTLSATDAVIQDLTVANCIDDLCVLDLSVVDSSISGILSVQEEIVGCDLTVGCNINMNNSISPAIGNINKIGNRFIHNFGVESTFVGVNSGNFTFTGMDNTGFGFLTLTNITTGNFNTAVGSRSLQLNTIGAGNTAVGYQALNSNTTGFFNTAVGTSSLASNTVGVENVAVGGNTLAANTIGNQNTAVGRFAGFSVTSGSNNVLVGFAVGGSLTTGINNVYVDGNGVNPANESSTIRIGSVQTACYIQGIFGQAVSAGTGTTVFVDSAGKLGTVVSVRRSKENIEDIKSESARIFDLTPVKFIFKKDETRTPQFGLIADDVAEVFPELVINDKEGKPFSVRYEVLPVLLLNEMQKQQHKIQKQQHEIQHQQDEMQKQQQRMKILDSKVESMSSAFNSLKRQVEKFARG